MAVAQLFAIFGDSLEKVKKQVPPGVVATIDAADAVWQQLRHVNAAPVPKAHPYNAGDQAHYDLRKEDKSQWRALRVGIVAMCSCVLANAWHSLGCVTFSDGQALSCPVKTHSGSQVHRDVGLKSFCWSSCAGTHPFLRPVQCLVVGFFLQVFVVISQSYFKHLLDVTVELSLSDQLRMDPPGSITSWAHTPLQNILEKLYGLVDQRKDFNLLPTHLASRLALFINAFALQELILHAALSWKSFGISFDCGGSQFVHRNVEGESPWKGLLLLLTTLCLSVVIYIQFSIDWVLEVTVASSNNPDEPEDPVFEDDGHGGYRVREDCRHVLFSHYDKWELESHTSPNLIRSFDTVVLRPPRAPPATSNEKYQYAAIFFLALGTVCIHHANGSCWVCIQGLQVAPGILLSLRELIMQFGFVGGCGRPRICGTFSGLAVWLLLISLLLKVFAVYFKVSGQQRRVSDSQHPEVVVPLLDWRAHSQETLYGYERAKMQIPCYVWVEQVHGEWRYANEHDREDAHAHHDCRDDAHGRDEQTAERMRMAEEDAHGREDAHDCLEDAHGRDEQAAEERRRAEARGTWHRSSQYLRTVKLISPNQGSELWKDGLPGSYGPPKHFIEFEAAYGSQFKTIRQVVPSRFIPGLLYSEIRCGQPEQWKKLSSCSIFLAFLCVALELVLFGIGGVALRFCDEIGSGQCNIDYKIDHRMLTFKASTGPYLTAFGGIFALLGYLLWKRTS